MIRALAGLLRPRLALMNGAAAVGGYLLFPAPAEITSLAGLFCGVALLAAGGSALNQVMECDLDRLMERTKLRPLPNGDLTKTAATVIGGGLLPAGLLLLASGGGRVPPLLGGAALIWYLAVYTPLKRRTPFALTIGALCGALPPVIGWCMAGGGPADYPALLLAGLLYLWQMPHFWLFRQRHAADYRRAGLPCAELPAGSGDQSLLCGLWLSALIAAAMLLPALGVIERGVALWYSLIPVPLLIMMLLRSETVLFSYLNLFPLLVTVALFVQK